MVGDATNAIGEDVSAARNVSSHIVSTTYFFECTRTGRTEEKLGDSFSIPVARVCPYTMYRHISYWTTIYSAKERRENIPMEVPVQTADIGEKHHGWSF